MTSQNRFVPRSATSQKLILGLIGFSLIACGDGLKDGRFATGSQSIVSSADYDALYVASEHDGVIARLDLESKKTFELEVGGEPYRLARNDAHVFVTLSNQRSIAVLEDVNGELQLKTSIDVGVEPSGIVINEDGDRLYVAEAMDNRVLEIDAKTFKTLRRWTVNNEPRWLALHPTGQALYVAASFKGELTYIDLRQDNLQRLVEIPPIANHEFIPPPLPRPDFAQSSRQDFEDNIGHFSRRFTGDPTITAKGDLLLLPALFVDNNSPVMENDGPTDELPDQGGYASGGRFNSSVVIVPISNDGEPTHPDDTEVVLLSGTVDGVSVVAYPSSVSVDPEGEVALATIEGSETIVAFSIANREPHTSFLDVLFDSSSDELPPSPDFGQGFSFRPVFLVRTDAGPSGITFTDDNRGHVFGFLDRSIGEFDHSRVRNNLASDDTDIEEEPAFFDGFGSEFSSPLTRLVSKTTVINSRLPTDVEDGRRLFFSSSDSKMSANSAGISCASCHFRGRNDGLTWSFGREDKERQFSIVPRQTPSLAGHVSRTAPLRWDGTRATVAEDAKMTTQGLMGGNGLSDTDALKIQAFVDWTRDVDNPHKAADKKRLQNGSLIFHRPEVGCGGCHSGARATDNQTHYMPSGVSMQTRSLIGSFSSAPYMHDGAVKTLRDILKNAKELGMGDTSSLSGQEREDLLLYLKSL